MAKNSDLDRIKRAVRQRGTPATPEVHAFTSEFRTPDPIPTQPPGPHLKFYNDFFLMVEWTFGVAYLEFENFHKFLDGHEQMIADSFVSLTNGDARYLGTWWSFGIGRKRYRTLFQYKNESAIDTLKAGLVASPNFRSAMKQLGSYWAKDLGRGAYLYQPAALFSDLRSASALNTNTVDPLVDLLLGP